MNDALLAARTFRIALSTRFAFMVGYYGLPFVLSLSLQAARGLTSLETGLVLPMMLVGLGGPLTMPPMTALLLDHVPAAQTGVASGAFNTSRQLGGALAVAVFGALLAAGVLLAAAVAGRRLPHH